MVHSKQLEEKKNRNMIHTSSVSGNNVETTEEADKGIESVVSIIRHVIHKGSAESMDIVRVGSNANAPQLPLVTAVLFVVLGW